MTRLSRFTLIALVALVAPIAPVAPVAPAALVALVAPAFADITIKSTASGKGVGMSGNFTTTTFIKGSKMRTDTVNGNTTRSVIFDLDSQKMISFDSKKKEAEVVDMQRLSAQISKSVDAGEMKAAVTPNGKTKTIAGQNAAGYDTDISLPATIGGQEGMKVTVNLTGPIWIVKGAPGTDDYINFYKSAAEKGWLFSDPRAAQAQPGQAKAMAEMYRQLAATGGIPYEQEMNFKMSGEGPFASMMAKMGNLSSTTTVQSVETDTLAADLFAVPAGYKIKEQK